MGETIQKRVKSKVVHKHELEVNWLKSTYLPEQGEWVVYDVEVDTNGTTLELPSGRTQPYTYQRMKMGDGIHNVNQLPFITAQEAEKLVGYDIATALSDSDAEIPTSNAVLDAIGELSTVVEEAYETAGTAYGDVQTVLNTDLPDLDSRTIDKIQTIDTCYNSSAAQLTADESGITWNELFALQYGDEEHTGTILHRLPIVAGDNISFDVEEDIVKISADLGTFEESDPTVPAWAKAATKPTYNANEIGGMEDYIEKHKISLGLHADGLLYVFVNGEPVGEGIALEGGAIGDVIGALDENNNIILTGDLADGTYTLKYENADGTYTEIGSLVVAEAPEAEEIINQIPISTDGSGAVYNGIGYKVDARLASNGMDERTDIVSGVLSCVITGYIPAQSGDTIRMKNLTIGDADATLSNGLIGYISYLWLYNYSEDTSTFTKVGAVSYQATPGFNESETGICTLENGVYTFTVPTGTNGEVTHIRIQAQLLDDTSVITVNQEIT